jgi:hypothetical protein
VHSAFNAAHAPRACEPELRDEPERGAEHAEHRAERIGRIQQRDRRALARREHALYRRQRRAHGRGGGQQQQERPAERDRPLPRGGRLRADQREQRIVDRRHRHDERCTPDADQELAGRVPARRSAAVLDACTERERAQREAAEESGDHSEHRGRLVAQPQRALLRPDDLPAQAREARREHQSDRDAFHQPANEMP